MKTIILGTILSMFTLAACAQAGTAGADTQTVTIGAPTPKYDITQGVRNMSSDEFDAFTGSYDLANGKSLTLFTHGMKKYAVVQGEARHEIVATRANTFVALDKQLKMTIVRGENGDVSGEVLIAGLEPQAQAQAQLQPQPLAHVSARKHARLVAAHKAAPQLVGSRLVASR